jgi:hypothetical protein
MSNGTISTLTGRQRIAAKILSGVFVVTAALGGIALGCSVNSDPAHAESGPTTCTLVCGASGTGTIGQTSGLAVGGATGTGSIGAVAGQPAA